jgi:hypothetical protein
MKYILNRYISIFALFLLFILAGCETLFPPKEIPEPEPKIDSLQIQQKQIISETASELLNLSKQQNPELYEQTTDSLQRAITEYLRTTRNPADELLLLNHNGSIILMPFSIVMADTQLQQVIYQDTTEVMYQRIGKDFAGEIVDLLVLDNESGDPSFELAVLFPDSLLIFQNYLMDEEPFQVIRFDQSELSRVKALNSNGLIANGSLSNSTDFSLITSALQRPLFFARNEKMFTATTFTDTSISYDYPGQWRPIQGQGIFQPRGQQIIPFRGFSNFDESAFSAVLDESGFLHLLDKETNSFTWSSSRPWGDRVFHIADDSIAVVNNPQKSFIVFTRADSQFIPVGHSQEFDDNIAAISPGSVGGNRGLLLALKQSVTATFQQSYIQFIPLNAVELQPEISYPIPNFPNYNSQVNLVLRHEQINPDSGSFSLPLPLQRNLYETFFKKGPDNQVLPLLADVKSHSDDYTRWDFTLRDDVYYSSGRNLLASDIENGWIHHLRTCRLNNHDSEWIWLLIQGMSEFMENPSDDIPGITAIDQSTIRIQLTSPQPRLPELLTSSCFAVRLPVEEQDFALGTGAFQINQIDSSDGQIKINAGRNPYYHAGMSPIRTVQFRLDRSMVSESVSQYENMLAITNRVNEAAYFRKLSAKQVRSFPAERHYFLAINPTVPPLNNIALRQVIANAIDREITASIINEVDCSALSRFYSPSITRTSPPENFAPQKFVDDIAIQFLQNDIISRHIAERLAARLTQLRIPHLPPEAVSGASIGELRRNGDYTILIDSYAPHFQHGILNLAELMHRGYALSDALHAGLNAALSTSEQTYPAELERTLISDAYLFPMVSVTNYAAAPLNIQKLLLYGYSELDLTGTWLPR